MNKTVIVFTTRYLDGERDLFSGERCTRIPVRSETYSELASFWGKKIHDYYKREEMTGNLPANVLRDFKTLINWNGEENLTDEHYDNFVTLTNEYMGKVADLCSHWPSSLPLRERCMTVYRLGEPSMEQDIEIYALWCLPEKDLAGGFEWETVLRKSFQKDSSTTLYLIMHGSTDLGDGGPFKIKTECERPLFHLARFCHEITYDEIAKLLRTVRLNDARIVLYVYERVKSIFQTKSQKCMVEGIIGNLMTDSYSEKIYEDYRALFEGGAELAPPEYFQKLSVFEKLNEMKRYYLKICDE